MTLYVKFFITAITLIHVANMLTFQPSAGHVNVFSASNVGNIL